MLKQGQQVNVAILVYENVEMIDMVCPLDTFNKVNYFKTVSINGVDKPRYNIYTVGETAGEIRSQEGLVRLVPDYTFKDINDNPLLSPDIIVIPGITLGPDKDNNRTTGIASVPVLKWIAEMNAGNKQILAVCIGVFSLAATGLLGGKYATTHYLAIDYLANAKVVLPSPKLPVIPVKNMKYVDSDENIVTTGGLTCGIAGALRMIEKFDGNVVAQNAADILVVNRDAPLPPNSLTVPYDIP